MDAGRGSSARSSASRWSRRSAPGSGWEACSSPPQAVARRPPPRTLRPPPASPTEFGVIQEAWDTIHREYVGRDELDDQELIWGAIDGLTQAVGDTGHTDFMTPEERAAAQRVAERLVRRHRRPHRPDRGRPAAHRRRVQGQPGREGRPAGRRRHRRRRRHVHRPTRPSTRSPRWSAARPARPSSVTVQADGTGPERTLDIVRADVPIEPVSWTIVPGTTTALIRLDQFSNGAADDIVQTLKDARAAGAERIVLDLRGNPGGYVNEAVGVGQPVPDQRRRLHRAQRPGRRGRPRRVARRRRHRPAARRPRRRQHRQQRRRSCRARSRTPGGRRSSARPRTARAPSSASSSCRTARRCASGRSSG